VKIHITKVETIKAKSGVEWFKVSGVNADTGEVVETMVESAKLTNKEEVSKAVVSPKELQEAFGGFEPCQIFFDRRGRLDSIEA